MIILDDLNFNISKVDNYQIYAFYGLKTNFEQIFTKRGLI